MIKALVKLAVVLALSCACGQGGTQNEQILTPTLKTTGPQGRDLTVPELQSFADFPIYWLGTQHGPYPLERIIRSVFTPGSGSPSKAENLVLIVYGECTPVREEGCSPPLTIRIEPACNSRPEAARAEGPDFEIRAATVGHVGGQIRIWTRDVTITVSGASEQGMIDAADQLTAANGVNFVGVPELASDPFPPFAGGC